MRHTDKSPEISYRQSLRCRSRLLRLTHIEDHVLVARSRVRAQTRHTGASENPWSVLARSFHSIIPAGEAQSVYSALGESRVKCEAKRRPDHGPGAGEETENQE